MPKTNIPIIIPNIAGIIHPSPKSYMGKQILAKESAEVLKASAFSDSGKVFIKSKKAGMDVKSIVSLKVFWLKFKTEYSIQSIMSVIASG